MNLKRTSCLHSSGFCDNFHNGDRSFVNSICLETESNYGQAIHVLPWADLVQHSMKPSIRYQHCLIMGQRPATNTIHDGPMLNGNWSAHSQSNPQIQYWPIPTQFSPSTELTEWWTISANPRKTSDFGRSDSLLLLQRHMQIARPIIKADRETSKL